ncbi:MAG TPA: hypothetical protein VFK89_00730 [Actinomycetota bacterium]|nr:hypothetical protein [Actinomycetota bacterium]
MKILRSLLTSAVVAGTLAAALGGSPASAQGGAPTNTADREILVVTANLEEAFSRHTGDSKDPFEIGNFAARVVDLTPALPDVLLIQEINHDNSLLLARKLTQESGQRYFVGALPRRAVTVEYPKVNPWKEVFSETAIILNKTQMSKIGDDGVYTASYPRSAAAPGEVVSVKRHAYMLAQEKSSGVKVPLVSLHYAMVKGFKTERLSNKYRGIWSRDIENLLARKYNADDTTRLSEIGGDFNASRCYKGAFSSCQVAAWEKVLTSAPHQRIDSLRSIDAAPAGVDVIFTNGRALDGGWDEHGDFRESDRQHFYSDHRFRWVVLTPRS